jgi:uncharacterized protein YndB with AHSA1/START domain
VTYDLRIERLIDAALEPVFDAFVGPDAQEVLYDNEEERDWTVESKLHLRVGGTWTIVSARRGRNPSARPTSSPRSTTSAGWSRSRRCSRASTGGSFDTTVTVTFEDCCGKTLLTILQVGFDSREERAIMQGGWPSIIDALERVLGGNRG